MKLNISELIERTPAPTEDEKIEWMVEQFNKEGYPLSFVKVSDTHYTLFSGYFVAHYNSAQSMYNNFFILYDIINSATAKAVNKE